ncbi:MAG: hypothetical protein MPL62_08065 [Alphaproteobacteria bacterium]|nr:hypothetical protein [Alphaproteobacteria bacterium]
MFSVFRCFARNIKTPRRAIFSEGFAFGISGRKIQTLGVLAQANSTN